MYADWKISAVDVEVKTSVMMLMTSVTATVSSMKREKIVITSAGKD